MSASFSLTDADGYVPLEGLIDRDAEIARQQKEAEKLRGFIAGHEKKLSNASFVDRAPPEVVAEVRETLANLQKQLASAEDVVRQLAAG
jgi:valyl-tRNA synthetase